MSMAQPGEIAPATASHHVIAQLATGGFLLLAGALFAAPFLLNAGASGNDVFITNSALAPLISLVGSVLYLLALRRLGLPIALMLALLIVNLAVLTSWLWLPQLPDPGVGLAIGVLALLPVILLVDAALLFLISALVAARHRQWTSWRWGVLLAVAACAALAVIYYFCGGQYLAFGETSSSLPPYLNAVVLLATVGIAVALYLLCWLWSHAQETQPVG
jgi:hypothetical protein